MNRLAASIRVLSLALASLLSGACASSGQLVAADGSRRMVARDNSRGLTMVVTTGAWPGGAVVEESYSVIHVLIDNQGQTPVLVAPGDFQLRDQFGFLYSLYDPGGSFQRVDEADQYADRRDYDPGHNTPFSLGYSADPAFARAALPWGVLEAGTQIRGFLYFDKLSDHANRGTLIWRAQTPTHQAVTDMGFAFFVARKVEQSVPPQ